MIPQVAPEYNCFLQHHQRSFVACYDGAPDKAFIGPARAAQQRVARFLSNSLLNAVQGWTH
jgi:hypothetical protein